MQKWSVISEEWMVRMINTLHKDIEMIACNNAPKVVEGTFSWLWHHQKRKKFSPSKSQSRITDEIYNFDLYESL